VQVPKCFRLGTISPCPQYPEENATVNSIRKSRSIAVFVALGAFVMLAMSVRAQTPAVKDDRVSALMASASKGVAADQAELGWMYLDGIDVDAPDPERALYWFTKAADQNNAAAQRGLGIMYAVGRGVAKDEAAGASWMAKAAAQGDMKAQYNLGAMYNRGLGLDKDHRKAAELFAAASRQGHVLATTELAHLYLDGRGVEMDTKRAAELYRQSADNGDAKAQLWLGKLYAAGAGVRLDEAEGLRWKLKAAEQGITEAQRLVAINYYAGLGTTKDPNRAIEWAVKAAAKDDMVSHVLLGDLYKGQQGVPADRAKSAEHYGKAALQGHAAAQYEYAICLLKGEGIKSDVLLAYAWFSVAASTNDDAKAYIAALDKRLTDAEVAEAKRLQATLPVKRP
jgi:TPR repeat protein